MRFWTWLLARLAVAIILVGWVFSYVFLPSSGDREFRRTLEAYKTVNTIHYTLLSDNPAQSMEDEADMACSDDSFHHTQTIDAHQPTGDVHIRIETMRAGGQDYRLQNDGRWKRDFSGVESPRTTCGRIAQGDYAWVVPDIRRMLEHGIIEKGDKKMVNGQLCREWKITLRQGAYLEHRTVCIGVKDHLPLEMVSAGGRETYAFNTLIQIDPPTDVVPLPAQDTYRPPAPGLTLTDDRSNEN